MPAGVRIRPARPADHEALSALFREADTLHARILPGFFRRPARAAARARDDIEKILRSPDETILVADGDAGVVGLVHLQIYDTPAIATMVPKRRAHIDNLIVDEPARRGGIGRRLVDAATTWARERNAAEILLTVWAGNEAAEKFYAALGFGRVNSVLGRSL
jgi:ribosomal protein S18 acetylase RimI-like enzyme